jgi:hypothetical protein
MVRVLNPYKNNKGIFKTVKLFYDKYYNDENQRYIIFGINPGRLGAGITGIPFTDSKRLKSVCQIDAKISEISESSSEFIYEVIMRYGGVDKFYKDFIFASICPLGFVRDNQNGRVVNFNYYDNELDFDMSSFILESIKKQASIGVRKDVCFCLGSGKNMKYLTKLNDEHKIFSKILALEHPRFIMQYNYTKRDIFVEKYLKLLKNTIQRA